jgi:hypothetical protein
MVTAMVKISPSMITNTEPSSYCSCKSGIKECVSAQVMFVDNVVC